ncbi:PREDICTED: serine protease snake-like, partial [Nicrophorus vespilloides]|uniref:Serine protease snake-like n=1 Tax=Nicrophorus vespilloides TaxID=110193 RepID=A0ABM1MS12_NICVS
FFSRYIPKYARLGEIVKTDLESDDSNFLLVNISRVIKHPKFDENKILNDIGLIELESKVKFNDYIKPACLNTENAKPEADSFIATGWGKTEHVSKSSSLLKVTLDEIVSAECAKIYKNKVKIDVEKHICTKSEKKDTCLGDSGGPLQKLNPNYISTYDIYGIISFGAVKCGSGFPSVSTRVSYYIDWIESIVFANDAKK